MDIGTIKQTTIADDGIDCIVSIGAGAEVTATIYGLSGVECYPLPGDEVKLSRCGGQYVIDAVFREKHADLAAGESMIYGRDSGGSVVSTVHVLSDGTVKINGGGRSSVGFADLKSGFDQLKQDFDTFASTHVHPGVTTGPGSTLVVAGYVPSTASIDAAESDSVEVP